MNLPQKMAYFIKIFTSAEKHYASSTRRLSGEGRESDWQTLIATIMSAQSRDETTIPIAETLFRRYPSLEKLSSAHYEDVLLIFSGLNYNRTKARHVIAAAHYLVHHTNSKVPNAIEELIKIPGVGRKTANLVLSEVHAQDSITVDTHVHRISNVLGFVKTKTPEQTERALQKIVPQHYWSQINRLFVLWGKDVPGRDKKKLLRALKA